MQHKEYCQKYCKNFVWRQMIIRLIMVIIYANMKPLRNTPEINIFYFIYISIKIQSIQDHTDTEQAPRATMMPVLDFPSCPRLPSLLLALLLKLTGEWDLPLPGYRFLPICFPRISLRRDFLGPS